MNVARVVSMFFLVAIVSCASNRPSGAPLSLQAQIAQVDLSLKLVSEKKFAEAEGVIQPVIHAKNFGQLPSAEQYRALLTAAKLAFTLKEPKLEYESRVRLLALPEATADDRMSRLNAANRLGDIAETLAGLTDLAKKNPERLEHMNYKFILRVLNESGKQLPHGAALPLMQALYAAHWKLVWGMEPNGIWQDFALLLLEHNSLTEAIDVSMHVTDEYALISMRSDRRFDAITAANPAQFDVDAAVRKGLEHFQWIGERTPKSLTPRAMVLERLLQQQHYGAGLALADGLVAEIRLQADPRQWYDDFDERYVWILDTRSRLLQRLGRWDDGIDQLAAASYVPESDGKNVSQVINLAELYCDLGKPTDGLNTLVRLGSSISAYGRMQEVAVRLNAAIQLSNAAETEKWFGYIKEHRRDAPRTYEDALLRMDDLDGASKWLIERLEDKDMRSSALLAIQDYAVPRETARQTELRKRRRAMMANEDVQAEIQKVGRVESYKFEALGQ
jgi:hypothetical protein